MQRRHPHLYGIGDEEEWDVLKARERGRSSVLGDLPRELDPLARAHRLQERVSGVGIDWEDAGGAFDKVEEELGEGRGALTSGSMTEVEEENGGILVEAMNRAR